MVCTNFYFKGSDNTDIHVYKYKNKNKTAKAIIQIAHGMSETADRYKYFAKKLTDEGYIVYINDHRGHGKTAKVLENVGYLADENGFYHLVEDMNILTKIIKKENDGLPIYLFGHSMGSFASQYYIMKYPSNIDGLILSGSNGKHGFVLDIAQFFIKHEIKKHGRRYRSKFIDSLIFGGNNKRFKNAKTEFDWLSRDENEVNKYIENPFCGVIFTCGFFYDFTSGLKEVENKKNFDKIPKNLPIYIFSGDKDPVGKFGKGVKRLKERYVNVGVKDVSMKLYNGGRHEMLNELNKDEVILDIIDWIKKR